MIKDKFKKYIIDISKRNVLIRKLLRKVLNIKNKLYFKIHSIGIKTDENTIIFGCFNGRSYCDSPKALYKYILADEKFNDFNYIWIFKEPEKHKYLEENKNTTVISEKGKKYVKAMAKAKYWIFNYKIPDYIYPKKDQVFVQCWHGTPLKRLGCDLQHFDNVLNTLEGMKKRYKEETKKFSYFLSPSKFASEKFVSIWNMKESNKENCIVEMGYPRNDFLYNYTQEDVKRIKENLGILNSDKKIILYAPTYRDNQHTSGVGYTYKTEVNFDKLKNELNEEYIILFRSHWLVANLFDFDKYKGFVYNVSDYDDIDELYIISDLLITDYSSVFFDYANLKRPIFFYMYDLEEYRDDIRGFYLDLKELPGPILKEEDELIKNIKNTTIDFYDDKYKAFNQKFNYLDDGKASERVIKKVFIRKEEK